MSKTFAIDIPCDSGGYVRFECPYCHSEFKLLPDEFQPEGASTEELFCPYCGLVSGSSNFFTQDVVNLAETIAANYMIDELNSSFGAMANDINRSGNGLIKMTYKPLKKANTKELVENDTVETVFTCLCCGNHEKVLYCAGASKIFCAYCGVDI